jgi:hypothetical protein
LHENAKIIMREAKALRQKALRSNCLLRVCANIQEWPMGEADQDTPEVHKLDYLSSSLQSESRWRKVVARTAIFNMVLAIAWVLLVSLGGNASDRVAIGAWVICSALFGISYGVLLVQFLALKVRRNVRIQVWVSAWTIVIGLIAATILIGFLCFIAVL